MPNHFFEQPILNSPYAYTGRHLELDPDGQPTDKITESRRRSAFITPVPKPKKRRQAGDDRQSELLFKDKEGISTPQQQYDPNTIINEIRGYVDQWRKLPNPDQWQVTPETARLLQHWRSYPFASIIPFFCQIEAVETGLWLTEVAPHQGERGRKFPDYLNYEHIKELSGLGSLEAINQLGGTDLPGFKSLSPRPAVRPDQPGAPGGGVSALEHRGESRPKHDRGVSSGPERGERVSGRSGDSDHHSEPLGDADPQGHGTPAGAGGRNQQDAGWPETILGSPASALATSHQPLAALTPSDFPLSLTTSHYAQVTVRGVAVFKLQAGEVVSAGPEGIACWFIDTDYNEESLFVRHAYFLGANDPYQSLKTTLKAEIDREAWEPCTAQSRAPSPSQPQAASPSKSSTTSATRS
jgi:hypothetical protein